MPSLTYWNRAEPKGSMSHTCTRAQRGPPHPTLHTQGPPTSLTQHAHGLRRVQGISKRLPIIKKHIHAHTHTGQRQHGTLALQLGCTLFRKEEIPARVPPVPAAHTNPSTLCPLCRQICVHVNKVRHTKQPPTLTLWLCLLRCASQNSACLCRMGLHERVRGYGVMSHPQAHAHAHAHAHARAHADPPLVPSR